MLDMTLPLCHKSSCFVRVSVLTKHCPCNSILTIQIFFVAIALVVSYCVGCFQNTT